MISAVKSNSDACSLLPRITDEISALRGAGLARLRALRREYSRRLRDAGSRSVLRLASELKNSGVVHRFFSDELIARERLHFRVVREVRNKLRTGLKTPPSGKAGFRSL